MFGPYANLEELLEATKTPPTGQAAAKVIAPFAKNSKPKMNWKPFDTIEVYKKFREAYTQDEDQLRSIAKNNFVAKAILQAFLVQEFPLKVYVQGIPDGNMPEQISRQFAFALTRQTYEKVITSAISRGHLVRYFYVYLVGGLDRAAWDTIVNQVWTRCEEFIANKSSKETVAHYLKEITSDIKSKYWKEQILGVIKYRVHEASTPGGHAPTELVLTVEHEDPPFEYASGERRNALTASDYQHLMQTPIRSNQPDVRLALHKLYTAYAWDLFDEFVKREATGPEKLIGSLLKQAPLRHQYDAVVHPDRKRVAPPGEMKRDTGEHPFRGFAEGRSKVVGSIKSSEYRFDTVTADPAYRAWLQSDGSVKKPEKQPVDQRDFNTFFPVAPVAPLLENAHYKITFGIHYDNPLLSRDSRGQTYWYANRSQFLQAAYQYAVMTGDRPTIAFFITSKLGSNANEIMSENELSKHHAGPEARDIIKQKDDLVLAFWRHADQGQRAFPILIAKWFGVSPDKYVVPYNPNKDVPENIDPADWHKYRAWVQKTASTKLGLNLSSLHDMSAKDKETMLKLQQHPPGRDHIAGAMALNRTRKFTGERDEKGNPIEPWGVYLIQYALAYGMSDAAATPTFMVPINVIKSTKGTIPPHRTLTKVLRNDLEKLLRTHWPDYKVTNPRYSTGKRAPLSDWKFIAGNPALPFPYPRLVRPLPLADAEVRDKLNAKYPNNVRRTTHGFQIDGVTYDAFVMLVAMPPSVVEKEFNLLKRDGTARQLISDPTMLSRLKGAGSPREMLKRVKSKGLPDEHPENIKGEGTLKQMGLMPRSMGVQFMTNPYEKASQEVDPFKLLNMEKATPLGPEYYLSQIGERWKPKITTILTDAGNVAYRAVTGFEHEQSPEKRKEMYANWLKAVALNMEKSEDALTQLLKDVVAAVDLEHRTTGSDMARRQQLYLDYVRRETAAGGAYKEPQLIYKIKMTEFQAPIGSTGFRNIFLTIKAPSEDIAKLMILYRLLRRSVLNKELGKQMLAISPFTRQRVFPDLNARLLAQWAAAHFIVIAHEGPKGTRFQPPRHHPTTREYAAQRAAVGGEHRFARMLGFK